VVFSFLGLGAIAVGAVIAHELSSPHETAMQTQEQSHGVVADARHLCDTCQHNFAVCESGKIVWGIDRDPTATGADADKVLECDGFLEGKI
jgi:hypothetical protein